MSDLILVRAAQYPDALWYLATPYTRYGGGLDAAFEEAARATAWLLDRGVPVFSPIVHSHPVARHTAASPVDHGFWMNADRPFVSRCNGLIVCTMPGWATSRGVREEIALFTERDRPILTLPWPLPA